MSSQMDAYGSERWDEPYGIQPSPLENPIPNRIKGPPEQYGCNMSAPIPKSSSFPTAQTYYPR